MALGTLGKYTLIEPIGRGTMGEVLRAQDSDGRIVALKVMSPGLSEDEELVERFRREALAASRLTHPNITRVYEYGQIGGQLYMAMELLQGRDLRELIAARAVEPLERKLEIMLQVCSGMAFVHAHDMVHRDLKPANIHVEPDGQAKIMDFGLVRLGDSVMTQAGSVMGSPSYMAPEIVMGQTANARTDVFSLGGVFYELLSGQRAFPGKVLHQILMAVMYSTPPPLSETAPEVPPAVVAVVDHCLCKKPEERFADAGQLHAALKAAWPVG